jgi:hypothetical protein
VPPSFAQCPVANYPHDKMKNCKPELFALLYTKGNPQGPWAGDVFKELCPYKGVDDDMIYGVITPETIAMRRDLLVYLRARMTDPPVGISRISIKGSRFENKEQLLKGLKAFKIVFLQAIFPSFKLFLGLDLWDWITGIRKQYGLGFQKYVKLVDGGGTFGEIHLQAFTSVIVTLLFGSNLLEAPMEPIKEINIFCKVLHAQLNAIEWNNVERDKSRMELLIASVRELEYSK